MNELTISLYYIDLDFKFHQSVNLPSVDNLHVKLPLNGSITGRGKWQSYLDYAY